ncbi:MAG TPA: NUDIX domain-containing protein [Allosphingosinicella sp.]|jgi:8-oxo-dGTP pyrophosphatase MutT (NUDIX family)
MKVEPAHEIDIAASRAEPGVIRIVAAVIMDGSGRVLLVRKRGTTAFMQPGGKPVGEETERAALEREIFEELGCALEAGSCRPLGRFRAPAANEPGWTVDAGLFSGRLSGEMRLDAEIEEAVWVDPDVGPPLTLAPLTRRHALPLARDLKLRAGQW